MSNNPQDLLPPTSGRRRPFLPRVVVPLIVVFLIAETALFFGLSRYVPWVALLAVAVITGVLGVAIIGFAIIRYGNAIAARLDRDECLDEELIHGLLLMLAGVLLLLPGLLSDMLGLILLLPQTRRLLIASMRRHAARSFPNVAVYPRVLHPSETQPATEKDDQEQADGAALRVIKHAA